MGEREISSRHGNLTVFVDNLPIDIRKVWVYNLFSRYGNIRDIFIPKKRSKVSGQGFGFVRFEERKEAAQAVTNTNGIWVWNQKLMVNLARFTKEGEDGRMKEMLPPNPRNRSSNFQDRSNMGKNTLNRDSLIHTQGFNGTRSEFEIRGKEIWRKKNQAESSTRREDGATILQKDQGTVKSIHLQPIGNGWLARSAVGKIRRLISAEELERIIKKETTGLLSIKPIGGRFLILTFADEETRNEWIKMKWSQLWFEDLRPWGGEQAQEERFVWISCYGMPLNVWNVPSFRAIGSNWGHFIEVYENTLKEASYEKGRLLIATEHPSKIEGKVQLIVDGKRYMVRVEEEQSFRIVKSSKHLSSLVSEGSKGLVPEEEDDDMDMVDVDMDTNHGRKNKSGDDNVAGERVSDAVNAEANKDLNGGMEIPTDHEGVKAAKINTLEGNNSQVGQPMAATNPILELVEVSNNEESQASHGLDSVVQDSLSPFLENETPSPKSRAKGSEVQVVENQGGVFQQQECEKDADVNCNLGLIESNCQVRESQVKGISLQVVLHPNDTRKEYRKKLRRQKFDNSQSQNLEDTQEEDGIESDLDDQRQALLDYELQTTTDTGKRLGIRYEDGDIRAIKKMIEIEAKDYFLLQRSKSSK